MKRVIVLILGAAALTGCVHSRSAHSIADAWCAAIQSQDEQAAERLMTEDLRMVIGRLRQTDAEFRRLHPSDKPPLGDGLRLASFPDATGRCEAVRVDADTVDVRITPPGTAAQPWSDRLYLRSTPQGYRINDVGFGTTGGNGLQRWAAEAIAGD